jgi:serine/threonine protein kinase
MLILETKSKMADNTKRTDRAHIRLGEDKTGKPAWRIDKGEIEYINLVVKGVPGESASQSVKIQKVLWEAVLAKWFSESTENILEGLLGQIFEKQNKNGTTVTTTPQISLYQRKGEDNLNNLQARLYALPKAQKLIMLMELFEAVHTMHQKGYVHQDITLSNIIVFYNASTKTYHLKLNDFGNTVKLDSHTLPTPTLGFESPEISYYYFLQQEQNTPLYQYYFLKGRNESYARELILYGYEPSHPGDKPSIANDMWALGVVAFKLLYRHDPSTLDENMIAADPLLSRLLHKSANERFKSMSETMAICSRMIEPSKGLPLTK